ncbi:HAD family hydrolase [Mycolicibacillus koreensis]|nr:HAD family hydrolase [Mycolicibacillus koreensis]
MSAVLWDMDGTLVDSEKLWDIALVELYAHFGGRLDAAVRHATVGSSAEAAMRIVYTDLGRPLDPALMRASIAWMHARVGELFGAGLPWCPGARELLDALAAAAVPMALVTNTTRSLTDRALEQIGGHYFAASVCGDEVVHAKPAADPYRVAAAALGVAPAHCLVIEDSVTGVTAAQDAGCPVLVVPNAVTVPAGPGRHHVESLIGLGPDDLRRIHAGLGSAETDVTVPAEP